MGLGFVLGVRLKRQNADDAKENIGLSLKKNNKNQKTPRPILPRAGVKRIGRRNLAVSPCSFPITKRGRVVGEPRFPTH